MREGLLRSCSVCTPTPYDGVGTLGTTQTVKVDNVEHKVATVEVQAVKLWPPPPRAVVIYSDPWYVGPCCGPYLPGYPVYAPYAY